mmetsp:Transcript_19031/g.53707  ORF Transcript_19031/g.53707 Transcript_19031/m.53707 type:complete len:152 (-) Transcript_19031:220-675(-)
MLTTATVWEGPWKPQGDESIVAAAAAAVGGRLCCSGADGSGGGMGAKLGGDCRGDEDLDFRACGGHSPSQRAAGTCNREGEERPLCGAAAPTGGWCPAAVPGGPCCGGGAAPEGLRSHCIGAALPGGLQSTGARAPEGLRYGGSAIPQWLR